MRLIFFAKDVIFMSITLIYQTWLQITILFFQNQTHPYGTEILNYSIKVMKEKKLQLKAILKRYSNNVLIGDNITGIKTRVFILMSNYLEDDTIFLKTTCHIYLKTWQDLILSCIKVLKKLKMSKYKSIMRKV